MLSVLPVLSMLIVLHVLSMLPVLPMLSVLSVLPVLPVLSALPVLPVLSVLPMLSVFSVFCAAVYGIFAPSCLTFVNGLYFQSNSDCTNPSHRQVSYSAGFFFLFLLI